MDFWGVVTGAASATAAWVGLSIRSKERRADELTALRVEMTEAMERHAQKSSDEHAGVAGQVKEMIHTQAGILAARIEALELRFDRRVDDLYQSVEFKRRQGDDD